MSIKNLRDSRFNPGSGEIRYRPGIGAFQQGLIFKNRKRLRAAAREYDEAAAKRKKTYLADVAKRDSLNLV